MPVSDTLRRLLGIRLLEEEQRRIALDSAVQQLHRLESTLTAARARERSARHRIGASPDPVDRIAAVVETSSARRRAASLIPWVAAAENDVAALRLNFLAKRVERRQVESLIQQTEAQDQQIESRRDQQRVDDAHAARISRSAK
jgi:flagellar export protein FliJ